MARNLQPPPPPTPLSQQRQTFDISETNVSHPIYSINPSIIQLSPTQGSIATHHNIQHTNYNIISVTPSNQSHPHLLCQQLNDPMLPVNIFSGDEYVNMPVHQNIQHTNQISILPHPQSQHHQQHHQQQLQIQSLNMNPHILQPASGAVLINVVTNNSQLNGNSSNSPVPYLIPISTNSNQENTNINTQSVLTSPSPISSSSMSSSSPSTSNSPICRINSGNTWAFVRVAIYNVLD